MDVGNCSYWSIRNRWHVNRAAHKHKMWIWQLASVKLIRNICTNSNQYVVKIAGEKSPLILFCPFHAHIIAWLWWSFSFGYFLLVLMKLSWMFQRWWEFTKLRDWRCVKNWFTGFGVYICMNGRYAMVSKAFYSLSLSILFNRQRKLYFIKVWHAEWDR